MSGAGVDEAGDGPNPRVLRGRPDDGALAEKENDERARLSSDPIARAAALKRRRHPGADESPDDALLPDGFLLSQLDDEGRANVTWKSASPPRFRQHAASNAAGTHAGGAMVNQLLRMGRGNAAAVQQAKARSERRRMCEQLDAWVDAPSASGSGSGGGGGDGSLRNENGTVEGHARADVAAVASPNVAAAALLADVRAMSWADGADADPPPTGATPRRDASGNVAGTPGSIGRIPVGTVGRPSAGAPTSTPASASRLGAAPRRRRLRRRRNAPISPPRIRRRSSAIGGTPTTDSTSRRRRLPRRRRRVRDDPRWPGRSRTRSAPIRFTAAPPAAASTPPPRKRRNATLGSRRKVRRWTRGASSPRRDATTASSNSSLGRAATILGAASFDCTTCGPRRARFPAIWCDWRRRAADPRRTPRIRRHPWTSAVTVIRSW